MPSTPNPKYRVAKSAVGGVSETTAPSSNPTDVVASQSLAFASEPGGAPLTVQAPRSPFSNPVSAAVPGASMSSIHTPRPWVPQSLTYVMNTSTCEPA
jgi:hypothetical protein